MDNRDAVTRPSGHNLLEAVAVMDRLRAECPWDAQQTHASLVPYAIEEAYEVADAVAGGEPAKIAEELGDLLLQVLFHARVAAESGAFDIDDVAAALVAKMKRRHPHVFGKAEAASADDVAKRWQEIKAAERAAAGASDSPDGELAGALARLPRGLPAMVLAVATVKEVRRAGLDPETLAAAAGAGAPSPHGAAIGSAVLASLAAGCDPEAELRRWAMAVQVAACERTVRPGHKASR